MSTHTRGRGRPALGRIVEVRLPDDYLDAVARIQHTEGVKTRAEAIRAAIEHYPWGQRRKAVTHDHGTGHGAA